MLNAGQLEQFETDGYLVLPDFLSEKEVAALEATRARLVDDLDPAQHRISIFSTVNEEHQVTGNAPQKRRHGCFDPCIGDGDVGVDDIHIDAEASGQTAMIQGWIKISYLEAIVY